MPPYTKSASSTPLDKLKSAPKFWPSSVAYLRSPKYSSRIPAEDLHHIRHQPGMHETGPGLQTLPSPSMLVQIKPIKTITHPAYGQYGLMAARHLAPGQLILFYVGFVHGAEDSDDRSEYDLSLDRDRHIGVDAAKMGNEARFINDYRGVAPHPNAEFKECWVSIGDDLMEKRMGIFVVNAGRAGKRTKGISKGEEILVSYGKGFWNSRNAPLGKHVL